MSLILKGKRLIQEIQSHGFEAYIVGGAVRDLLLNKEPDDVDVSTNMPIDKLEELFDTHDIGKNKDFGIIVVNFEGDSFEVAQYRKDSIESNGRRPDSVEFVTTIQEDLGRRDFTINAMAYSGTEFIDPFGGQEDLRDNVLRFVGNAKERIIEDHLRILRALRFAAKMSELPNKDNDFRGRACKIEPSSMDAIVNNSHLLRNISKERITQELIKIAKLGGEKFSDFLKMCEAYGLLEEILWPIHKSFYFQHNFDNHPEGMESTGMNRVFSHIIEAVRLYDGNDPLELFCILFHDVGKPFTYSFEYDENKEDEPNRHRYKGHDKVGADFFREYGLKELKLSGEWVDIISWCIENHMNWRNIEKMNKKNIYKIVGHEYYPYLEKVVSCDERATFCENNMDVRMWLMERGAIKTDERLNNILELGREVREEYGEHEKFNKYVKSIFTGNDIIDRFGVSKGDIQTLIDEGIVAIVDYGLTDKEGVLYFIEESEVWKKMKKENEEKAL